MFVTQHIVLHQIITEVNDNRFHTIKKSFASNFISMNEKN